MQLSIIIINYNTFELTSSCIQSVIQHTYGIEYEVILVDNASTECAPEEFRKAFSDIILLPQSLNLGFARGNNAGIAVAKGEVILLLNSDTELQDNSIAKAYQKIISSFRIGALSSKLLYPNGLVQSCAQRFPSLCLEFIELFRLQKLLSLPQRKQLFLGAFFDHESELEADWIWGTFFMFRKEILNELPNRELPTDFFMYGEDMQWCYEIKKKLGYKIIYFPEAKVIHYLSASTNKNQNLNKQKTMIDNEYFFLSKYYSRSYAYWLFKIRALKYWTLSLKNKNYKPFVALYGHYSAKN